MLEIDYQEIFNKVKNIIKKRLLDKYIKKLIQYETVTASKPGGQHMQRKHTKVKAKFKTVELEGILLKNFEIELNTNQKITLREKERYLIAISEDTRSQQENKNLATERLLNKVYQLVNELFPPIKSQLMQEPFEAEEKRIKEKKIRSQTKKLRRKIKNITQIPEEQS
jgi:protein subunit release factor B